MRSIIATVVAGAIVAPAVGQNLSITIENTQAAGGMSFTPFWLGVHDNSFDVFNAGEMASGGITEIAEVGDTGAISARFDMEAAGGTQATFAEPNGPPVFSPGESATTSLNVMTPETYRYLQFASMVVPTNDLFIGNDDAIEVFDSNGNFNGPFTIEIHGSNVWDNGSEVNDIGNGPAFVSGVDGAAGADESLVVRNFFGVDGSDAYLASIVGTTTAPGPVVTEVFGRDTLIARITIVPAPGSLALLAPGAMLAMRRRR